MALIIYKRNDNLLVVRGAGTISPYGVISYFNQDTTVEVTLTSGEALVAGERWPMALIYIPGSQGDFQGDLRDTLQLPTSGVLTAKLVVDNGIGQHAELRGEVTIQERHF